MGGLWTPGSAIRKPIEGRAQEGVLVMGGSWFRAHSHIRGAVLICTGDSEAQGGKGHVGLLCPPYRAVCEPPGPGEGKGGGVSPLRWERMV